MERILALAGMFSVIMPACQPVSEMASCPSSCSAMARRALETCSPVEMRKSISLRLGFEEISWAREIRLLVVLPMAETTTTTSFPCFFVASTRSAIALIFSVVATELPPYFWTMIGMIWLCYLLLVYWGGWWGVNRGSVVY